MDWYNYTGLALMAGLWRDIIHCVHIIWGHFSKISAKQNISLYIPPPPLPPTSPDHILKLVGWPNNVASWDSSHIFTVHSHTLTHPCSQICSSLTAYGTCNTHNYALIYCTGLATNQYSILCTSTHDMGIIILLCPE